MSAKWNQRAIRCRKCGAAIARRRSGARWISIDADGSRHDCASVEVIRETLRALGELYGPVEQTEN